MKVFVSWSGDLSRQLGEAFRDWLPAVLQSVTLFFTPADIDKGARWSSEIAKELEASQFGVLFVTRDNLHSDWILFEAGALSKALEKAYVCPIIFEMQPTDLAGPLKQFQATSFERQDFFKLVALINSKLVDGKLSAKTVEAVFDKWWPDLDNRVKDILAAANSKGVSEKPLRTDRDLIEEILTLVRERGRLVNDSGVSPKAVRDILRNHIYLHNNQEDGVGGYQEVLDIINESARPIRHIARRFVGIDAEVRDLYKEMSRLSYTAKDSPWSDVDESEGEEEES